MVRIHPRRRTPIHDKTNPRPHEALSWATCPLFPEPVVWAVRHSWCQASLQAFFIEGSTVHCLQHVIMPRILFLLLASVDHSTIWL